MTGIGSSLVALTRVRADLTRIAAPPLLFVGRAEAASRFWEFFANRIRNVHTRRAYYRAVCRFADAIGARQVSDLAAADPPMIGSPRMNIANAVGEELPKPRSSLSTSDKEQWRRCDTR